MNLSPSPAILPLRIPCHGTELAATLYRPTAYGRHPVVIIHGGLAMPRQFYGRFASWLATQGYACMTYDYTGMFGSRQEPGQACRAFDLQTWASRDLVAVTDWCKRTFDDVPITALAHSFGGTLAGLSSSVAQLDALMLVNSGSAYWGHTDASWHQLQRGFFCWVGIPALVALFGHFPGKALGVLGDLPRDVALELARWCRHPDYMLGHVRDCPGLMQLKAPAISLSFDDDHVFPPRAVQWLADHFVQKVEVRIKTTSPADVGDQFINQSGIGLSGMGHFGFFDPDKGQPYWFELLTWLEEVLLARETHAFHAVLAERTA
jgi:predicted alpha/beta hydrolase